ncbi:MAG: adenosylcobinamide-GDP ribazoletransferase [Leptospiraceae bacterium]|nr:adenosylcobinamide-GDP ribazoletransferase [Leptospiraceae bacterium]MDW7975635.1 adenosylcobinamide-GDP ribazoletransferase [Leptospiraceae bacterium]
MLNFLRNEKDIFLLALSYYTRISVPKDLPYSEERLQHSTRYVAIIGWIVGVFSFVFYVIFEFLVHPSFGVFFSLLAGVWITGAFHEDGLTDTIDAFGGGWTKEDILRIMKDSRIGSFGTIGIFFLLMGKYLLLEKLASSKNTLFIFLVMILYHSLARIAPLYLANFSSYVRDEGKAKPIAKHIHWENILMATLLGFIPFFVFSWIFSFWYLAIVIPLVLLVIYLKSFFEKWIQGITGDCLGATEQIAEFLILLSITVIWKFTS